MAQIQSFHLALDGVRYCEIILIEQSQEAFRALVALPQRDHSMLSWHEQARTHATATSALAWAIRHIDLFCKRSNVSVTGIRDEIPGDIIGLTEQLRILALHDMTSAAHQKRDHTPTE